MPSLGLSYIRSTMSKHATHTAFSIDKYRLHCFRFTCNLNHINDVQLSQRNAGKYANNEINWSMDIAITVQFPRFNSIIILVNSCGSNP